MGKRELHTPLLGLVIGTQLVIVAMLVALWLRPEVTGAQTASTTGAYSVAAAEIQGQGDAFWIYGHNEKKLLCYIMKGPRLELLAVRDLKYDWRPVQYPAGRQNPSVEEMRKDTKGGSN